MTSLRFPLQLTHKGSLAVDTTDRDMDRSKVLLTVGTSLGERVMRPEFGAKTMWAFYMAGESIEDGMVMAIQKVFADYFPHLLLHSVNLIPDPHYDGSVIYVDLLWGYPGSTPNSPDAVSGSVDVSGQVNQIKGS